MIARGTLIQCIHVEPCDDWLRLLGVYEVAKTEPGQLWDCEYTPNCSASAVWICGDPDIDDENDAYCMCQFRIIAPPITEADRLEASAPQPHTPAEPLKVVRLARQVTK